MIKQFFPPRERLPNADLKINGIGIIEPMQPCYVNRPNGTNDRFMVLFHDNAVVYINGQEKQIPANSIMLWEENVTHHYGNLKSNWRHSWIHFYGYAAEQYIKENKIISNTPFILPKPEIFTIYLERLYNELTSYKQPSSTILKNQFSSLMREISRSTHQENEIFIPQRIVTIKNLLERFPEKRYTLQYLSSKIAISIPRLCAEFKKYMECSPISYQISCRMERASYLLPDYNLTINDIAERSGYSDIYQFSKAFKKYFGQSPSQYRKMLQSRRDVACNVSTLPN